MVKVFSRACVALVLAITSIGGGEIVRGEQIHLDISSYYNYDAVGTRTEYNYVVGGGLNSYVNGYLGDHALSNSNRTYTNQSSVPVGQVAMPDSGLLSGGGWTYQVSTAWDNGVGDVKSNNSVVMSAAGNTTKSTTFTLGAGQQMNYDALNIAFVAARGGSATHRSYITANYTDATSQIVYDTGTVAGTVGGTFGSAGGNSQGGFSFATDTDTSVQNLLDSSYFLGQSGSSQSIRSGEASVWQFSNAIALNPDKALESFTITLVSQSSGRTTSLWMFGATANAVPEPAAAMMLLPLAALLRRRSRA